MQNGPGNIDIEKQILENSFIRIVLDNLPIGVCLNKIDTGSAFYYNKKFEQIYGWPGEYMKDVSQFFKSVYPDEKYHNELMTRIMTDIQSGDPTRMHWEKCRVTHKDGSVHFVNAVNIPLFEYNIMVSTVMDITDIIYAEAALTKSEKQFRSLYENATLGIYRTSREGKILMANPALLSMLGYSSEEELLNDTSHTSKTYINKKDQERFTEIMDEEGIVYSFDSEWRKANGTTFWVRESARGIKDHNDEIIYYEGTVEDVTEMKKAVSALIDSKEKAVEMNRLKSNYLANMSHELRTPMIGILGYAEILEEESQENFIKDAASLIKKSGLRLMDTLNLILDLSRIEAGKLEINLNKVDIVKTTREITRLYEEAANKKSIYLTMQTKCESLEVNIDEKMFYGIMDNLINNALKFTFNGGILIKIYKETSGSENWAVINVGDTGIGISEENLPLIWEEFRQVSEGHSRNFEGTGLGLTITKKFIEELKGTITASSKPDVGSNFIVRFPITNE